MLSNSIHVALRVGIAGWALSAASVAIGTQFSGAIYTTTQSGTTVNANIYDNRNNVYLNGGPQHTRGSSLPDGDYYFAVTDPNGGTLLSTDAAACRQLTVANGVVSGPQAGNGCAHAAGATNAANGSTTVQLMPFSLTPNNGGEYKAWLVSQDPAIGCGPDKVIIVGVTGLSFPQNCAKTDNFKVREAPPV